MTRLRVAIAGVTHWHAPRYLQSLAAHDTAIVGVSDHDEPAGARHAEKIGCRFFADTADMLGAVRPDFVLLLPRHDLAVREAQAIAGRRLPTLTEKPMGLNADEAQRTAQALLAGHGFSAACLPNRHLMFWEAIERLRRDGELGAPIHASFRIINGPPSRYSGYGVPWMLDPARSGGGVLRNLASHGADAALVLGGGDLQVRGAVVAQRGYGLAVEDYATGTLAAPDGFSVTIEVGYSHADPNASDQEFRLAATGAYVVDANGTLAVTKADGKRSMVKSRTASDAYDMLVAETLARFRSGRSPVVDVAQCARAVAIIDAIYRAAR